MVPLGQHQRRRLPNCRTSRAVGRSQNKLRVLHEIDRAPASGAGVILGREALYSPTLSEWRRLLHAGALASRSRLEEPS
jgi:hypothetical protein